MRERVAHLVLTQTLRLRRGNEAFIESWDHLQEWTDSFVVAARRVGIVPTVTVEGNRSFWASVGTERAVDLAPRSRLVTRAIAQSDAYLRFPGPEDMPRYHRLLHAQSKHPMTSMAEKRHAALRNRVPICNLEFALATAPMARHLGIPLAVWRRELVAAAQVEPKAIARTATAIAGSVPPRSTVEVSHPNGTRLTARASSVRPFVDDAVLDPRDLTSGVIDAWVPGGAVLFVLDGQQGDGTFVANLPSDYHRGEALVGGRWAFTGGRMRESTFDSGAAEFADNFRRAGPGKDRISFLVVGLNPRLRTAPYLEDCALGRITLGIGGNRYYGGPNACPWKSWLCLEGASLSVNGRPLLSGGRIA